MRHTTDGFKIAEEDLKIRGAGEVLGTKQTGGLQFRIADLERDAVWLPLIRKTAEVIASQQPQTLEILQQRWIGNKSEYKQA
jgi:ATP-dependent DNA helicase RecG